MYTRSVKYHTCYLTWVKYLITLVGERIKRRLGGTSLVVQWLRLHIPKAGDLGLIPGQELDFTRYN